MAKTPLKRLGPGIYRDGNQLVIYVPELIEHFDLANTEANRERVLRLALRAVRQVFPDVSRIAVRRVGQTLRVSEL